MNQASSKVFIIDSHPTFRYGLRQLICENLDQVMIREFSSFDSLTANEAEKPDLIIAAVNDNKQFHLVRKLCTPNFRNLGILVFYTNCSRNHMMLKLAGNVDDILDKASDIGKVLHAINSLLFWSVRHKSRTQPMNKPMDFSRFSMMFNLSAREIEIARYLTQGMRTSDISALMQLKPSTISTYKNRILSKTETANVMELKDLMRV